MVQKGTWGLQAQMRVMWLSRAARMIWPRDPTILLPQCLLNDVPKGYLGAPSADEGHVVEQGCADDLAQGLHHVLDVHVAQQQAQSEGPLQLPDAAVDVLWLQQVEPEQQAENFGEADEYYEGGVMPWYGPLQLPDVLRLQQVEAAEQVDVHGKG